MSTSRPKPTPPPALTLDRGPDGRPRARWKTKPDPPSGAYLVQWLETDLQDERTAARVLKRLRDIQAARTGAWNTSGNAFGLTVGPRRVLIGPLHGPAGARPLRVATRALVPLVEQWLELLLRT
jgi:hypothetical protein